MQEVNIQALTRNCYNQIQSEPTLLDSKHKWEIFCLTINNLLLQNNSSCGHRSVNVIMSISDLSSYLISDKVIDCLNPCKPGVLFMGHRQTEKPQVSRRKTRRPIWGYSICFHDFHRKMK